jgi:8-oxo-dGTP diphosphatase
MKQSTPHALRFAVVAADVVLITLKDSVPHVRLMNVVAPIPQFTGKWCLPGAVLRTDETTEDTARRVALERGGIDAKKLHLEQLATFSDIDRDPRGRVVSVAYLALVPWENLTDHECADDDQMQWPPIAKAKRLAYDHDDIIGTALARLRARIHYTTLITKVMPKTFTLTELEEAYEGILGGTLDKRNFRRKILKLGILTATGEKRSDGAFRPAALYRFTSTKVTDIEVL